MISGGCNILHLFGVSIFSDPAIILQKLNSGLANVFVAIAPVRSLALFTAVPSAFASE